jgi:hypothetical protein
MLGKALLEGFCVGEKLMTPGRLSQAIELPARWLRKEALANRLPHLRVGRKVLFNIEAVRAALAARAAGEGWEAANAV